MALNTTRWLFEEDIAEVMKPYYEKYLKLKNEFIEFLKKINISERMIKEYTKLVEKIFNGTLKGGPHKKRIKYENLLAFEGLNLYILFIKNIKGENPWKFVPPKLMEFCIKRYENYPTFVKSAMYDYAEYILRSKKENK